MPSSSTRPRLAGADSRHLLVHCLSLDDEAGTIAQIKQRYEAPLKEIFE